MPLLSRSKSRRSSTSTVKSPESDGAGAEEQIRSLKDQVRSLEKSNTRLSTELDDAKEKVAAAAAETHRVKNALLEKEQAASSTRDESRKLHETIDDLTSRNQELQSKLTSAQEEKSIYAATLAEEVKNKSSKPKPEQAPDSTIDSSDEGAEVQRAIGSYLTKRNSELEELVGFLSDERTKLESRLESEGKKTLTGMPQASLHNADDDGEPQNTINKLLKRNQVLEAMMASLSKEKASAESSLAKEKNKSLTRTAEAKERKKRFEGKLAEMCKTIKEDIGDVDSFAERQKNFEITLEVISDKIMEDLGDEIDSCFPSENNDDTSG